ncbi:MAG: hypothetical protein WC804_17730 [Sphingomonas sp.]|jgi:hypothetical protein|uniref:hypothetical protein n=1 Tax=Sphingomonas sp. TaxID=28214 RepID=UPI003567FB78
MQAVGCIVILIYGVAQIWAAFAGAAFYTSTFWGGVIVIACLMLRFTLPLTIFGFLGAMMVWGWAWYWAALFVAPGLAFVIPHVLAQLVGFAMGAIRGR